MCALVLALAVGPPADPPAIPFDTLTLAQARKLIAADTCITFTPALPEYTWVVNGALRTITGPDDADGESRTVVLRGDQVGGLEEGRPLTVRGRLRAISHDAAVVGGVFIPAWDEIRFEEH